LELRKLMWHQVGPFRNQAGLQAALARVEVMRADELQRTPIPPDGAFAHELADWHELRNALDVARAVTVAALNRTESRGAHQREDHPQLDDAWCMNQILHLQGDELVSEFVSGDPAMRNRA
jgi:succinate dehydrogenase / fumarate reductase flavoprotein subunit